MLLSGWKVADVRNSPSLAAADRLPRSSFFEVPRHADLGRQQSSPGVLLRFVTDRSGEVAAGTSQPKFLGDRQRRNLHIAPIMPLVAIAMQFPVMDAALRYGEFVADLAAETHWPRELDVMGVGWVLFAD